MSLNENLKRILRPIYWKVRYSLPIWIDNHTTPPLIRSFLHRHCAGTLKAREKRLMRQFEIAFGRDFDIQNPQTLNEKMLWLKLFHPDPKITLCADKYRVRGYVEKAIGAEFLPKLIAAYDSPDEIDFSALPDRFVLKMNWGSGQNFICRSKSTISESKCRKLLKKWMNPFSNQYFFALEWGYRDIPPKIICEEYLEFLEQTPRVYKIMCFNAVPRVVQVVLDDKTSKETINYYDTDWNLLPFRQNFPNSPKQIPCPVYWEKMLEFARKLSAPFPFVRVDFYESPKGILFSELTFYSDGGLAKFEPEEWDLKLGEMLELPEPMSEEKLK